MFREHKHQTIRVINKTGSDIAKDKIVAVLGFDTTSYLPKIVLADADTAATHKDFYVVHVEILNGDSGYVFKGGISDDNIDTSSVTTVGDPIYLDTTTAGSFTTTAPTGGDDVVVPVGWVRVKSSTVGVIEWHISEPQKIGTNELQAGITITSPVITGALLTSAPVSAASSSLSVTAALHAGKTIIMNQSGGTTFTLPAPTATGNKYRFVCSVASNANIINADVTGTSMAGFVIINDAGDTTAATADAYPTASTSNRITMTTAGGGGATGDFIEVQDIATGLWSVFGGFKTSTDPVTPFSHF